MTPSSSSSGVGGPSGAAASEAAAATAIAPTTASRCWCVVYEEISAWWVACSGSSAYQAPSGAIRMAEPLPQDPCPLKSAEASSRQSPPSRTSRSSRFTAGPYPRSKSCRSAKEVARASWSMRPWAASTARTEEAISVSSVHCQGPGGRTRCLSSG